MFVGGLFTVDQGAIDSFVSTMIVRWSIPLVFGALFLWSYHKEPRRFRNALLFLVFTWSTLNAILPAELLVILWGILLLSPIWSVIYLLVNGSKVIAREGASLSNALPTLLAIVILIIIPLPFVAIYFQARPWVLFLTLTVWCEAFWAAFTLAALMLYSWFYQTFPRKTRYDYIVVHGAGLMPDGTPTPLLAGRIDKAAELWKAQDCEPVIVASGGQGSDEVVSEAESIGRYLQETHGVPEDHIIREDHSTSTWENLEMTKELLDEREGGSNYRCCLVTSDYHVFRAVEYAHKCGLATDGVGSKTARYYYPTAFLREYIAITLKHWWPYGVIALLGLAVCLFLGIND